MMAALFCFMCHLTFFVMHTVPCLHLVAEYFCKSFNIFTAPAVVHLSVFSFLRLHEIVRRRNSEHRENFWFQHYLYRSADVLLCAQEQLFDVAHGRFKIVSFVQPVAIPCRKLIL